MSGFWIELRTANGALLYRRIMTDPIRDVFEGPDLDNNGTIPDRKEAVPVEKVFSLLVPRTRTGDVLVIFSSPLRPGAQGQPATEVGRILFGEIIP